MGLSKQKSSPIDSYQKQHIPGSKYYCLNTVSKQCNVISMGLSKQKSSTSTRKQVLLKYCVSKQHNVISMGLSKQKSRPIDSYKKQHIPGSKYYCLNTVSKQCNVISMGLSKQKSSTSTRKQVLLKYCVSKQHNVISMGLSKQKSRPIDSYKKQHIPGSKYY